MALDLCPPLAPYVPQELIDHIIDHLYDERLTLSSCSLVNRAWLPTSRFHLFAKVSLTVTPPTRAGPSASRLCRRLHRLLTTSPSIIQNIRELNIGDGIQEPRLLGLGEWPVGMYGPAITRTTWVTTERTLPPLLRMLTHLKRLEFSAQSPLHWHTLPPSLQTSLRHVFSLPTTTYVRLTSWCFAGFSELNALFSSLGPNLKGIALSSTRVWFHCADSFTPSGDLYFPGKLIEQHGPVSQVEEAGNRDSRSGGESDDLSDVVPKNEENPIITTATTTTTVSQRRKVTPEFLTLDYVEYGHLGYWLLSPQSTVDLKQLRELRVAQFHDVIAIEQLLVAVGSSLEHFHFKPGHGEVYPFDLSFNPGLRSLRLTLEHPKRALAWVKTLVCSLCSSSTTNKNDVFERLAIEFYTDLKQMPLDGWAELDAILVGGPELSVLRQVDIGLFAQPSQAEFVRVKEELAGLRAREMLRLYQLGIKSHQSSRQLLPRISRYENS